MRPTPKYLIALTLFSTLTTPLRAVDANAIIAKADDVRNPGESFRTLVAVKNHDGERSEFEVYTKGKDRTLIKTLAPKRDFGRNLLMLAEDMWIYLPDLKRAVRVSLSQKLTGEAANGDISRTRWSGDYQAALEEERVGDWRLLLTATRKGLTYDKIRVWIDKPDFHPRQAEFLTLGGSPLKTARYGAFKTLAGATRPSEITITDAKRPEHVTIISILDMEKRSLDDSLFNQGNLQ